MNREDFKTMAYGKYVQTHRDQTIEIADVEVFVDGAVWAFDKLNHQKFENIGTVGPYQEPIVTPFYGQKQFNEHSYGIVNCKTEQ